METKDILNEFLKTLLEGVQQAGAFVKEQLPLVLQEYVKWGVVEGALKFVLLGLATYLLLRVAIKWAYAKAREIDARNNYDDSIGYWLAAIMLSLGAVPTAIQSIMGLMQAAKAAIAPRVYLLEELSKLVQ